ncbi:ABC transporter permease [Xylanimonas ulmi]|uniref:Peptide/nickel transport system permease protein n=1 Tax=Xylanimonas ulmi TaxID=228973 RepID=A0A4Q7M4S3_9MICO|nr:ABC transporter permease [Xylanibacterium ulmi]RZS61937.1 peptide/nickel transport system permease protein [Xylanibacterium ulmi]
MAPMVRYVFERLGYAAIVVWGAFTGAFFLLYIVPGDAAGGLTMGASGGDVEKLLAEQRQLLGLDRPVLVQYWDALSGAVNGDFGDSIYQRRPAVDVFFEAFPATLQLAFLGLALAVVLGVTLSVVIELTSWRWLRETLVSLPPVAVSLPPFVVALLLVQVVAFKLGWIDAFGDKTLLGLLVASLSIAVAGGGTVAQLLTANLRGALSSPYIESARNWGLSRFDVVVRHALRNAALPVITALGTLIGVMVGGTVLTETVFSRVGVGRLIVDSVNGRDMPVVLIAVTVSALIFVTVNFVVDLIYPVVDKRIRMEAR